MTEYLKKSFSVAVGDSQEYRDGWDRIFGKKEPVVFDEIVLDGDTGPVRYTTEPAAVPVTTPMPANLGAYCPPGDCGICDEIRAGALK